VLSELLDLSISVWSLAISGSVIGMIGGLAAMNAVVDSINTTIGRVADNGRISKSQASAMCRHLADGTVVDLALFKAIVRNEIAEKGLQPRSDEARTSTAIARSPAAVGWTRRDAHAELGVRSRVRVQSRPSLSASTRAATATSTRPSSSAHLGLTQADAPGPKPSQRTCA